MNIELARKVLDYIERHPDEHDQSSFANNNTTMCGTTCCIAGHTMLLSGRYTLDVRGLMFVDQSGRRESCDADDIARDLLEMPAEDADALFYDFSNEGAMSRFRELILRAEKAEDIDNEKA